MVEVNGIGKQSSFLRYDNKHCPNKFYSVVYSTPYYGFARKYGGSEWHWQKL
jgi:hypothetical protein